MHRAEVFRQEHPSYHWSTVTTGGQLAGRNVNYGSRDNPRQLFIEMCRQTRSELQRVHLALEIVSLPRVFEAVHDSTYRGQRMTMQLQWCMCRRIPQSRIHGVVVMKKRLLSAATAGCLVALASVAQARSAYDGSWELVFVTQRGACDPTYNFSVNISNGVVTNPNLVRFRGYVARSGAVRASVTVQDKYASGSGRLSGASGRGTWSGHSGSARCLGYWTAQRN
jgi:hypothetical protein